jgi:hypothetical protein
MCRAHPDVAAEMKTSLQATNFLCRAGLAEEDVVDGSLRNGWVAKKGTQLATHAHC